MFTEADLIHSYSRAQAIDNGVLIDVPVNALSHEAGIKYDCAMTAQVYALLNPTDQEKAIGQDLEGRIWDMLTMFKVSTRAAQNASELFFSMLVNRGPRRMETLFLRATIGPGDDGEPVITFMARGES